MQQHIVIVGGGFTGIRAALDVARGLKGRADLARVTLVTDRPHFEYHAALYRVLAGHSPLEVCIPLTSIFGRTPVDVIVDPVVGIDLAKRRIQGNSGSIVHYDRLILAPGSETGYFHIPGLQQVAYGCKSLEEVVRLKTHLHAMLDEAKHSPDSAKEVGRIEVVGAGATGIEVAGELAAYLHEVAHRHHFDRRRLRIDVIEAAPKVAPLLPDDVGLRIGQRLDELGVQVQLGRQVAAADIGHLQIKNQDPVATRTIIWTAGVAPHHLVTATDGLATDPRGRIEVDDALRMRGSDHVYAGGDTVVTTYGGMAQTALDHGRTIARTVLADAGIGLADTYVPRKPVYALPVGPGWAAVLQGERRIYGAAGWRIRRRLDWRVYREFLSPRQALTAYRSHGILDEACALCRDLDRVR